MNYLKNTPLSSFLTKEAISYTNSLSQTRNNGISQLRLPLHKNKKRETNNQSIANYVTSKSSGSGDESKPDVAADSANEDKSNPVWNLLEITQKLSLRPPKFEFTEEEGLPHNKVFACRTEFESFVESNSF